MAREPGTETEATTTADEREIARLNNEVASLKGQLRQTEPSKAPVPVKYETCDVEQAARYQRVGGRVVTVVRRFPDRPFTPGKKYGFAETKQELEALVVKSKEAGIL